MRRVLRVLKIGVLGLVGTVLSVGALLAYYVYSPDAVVPPLSGKLVGGAIDVAGVARSYRLYVPRADSRSKRRWSS